HGSIDAGENISGWRKTATDEPAIQRHRRRACIVTAVGRAVVVTERSIDQLDTLPTNRGVDVDLDTCPDGIEHSQLLQVCIPFSHRVSHVAQITSSMPVS